MKDLLFLGISLVVAIVAGAAALYARAAGFSAGPETENIDGVTTLVVALALLVLLFYGLKQYPEKSARLIVAGVTVAGTLSGLILLKVSLEALGVAPIIFLIALPVGYLGLNWSLKGYFGSLSQKKTSVLMIASATLLGSLIGTSLPTFFAIVFLMILTGLDVVVVETNTVTNLVGPAHYDDVVSVVTLPLKKHLVGLGDFLAYSILTSATLHVTGVYGAIETVILILVGAIVTFKITKLRKRAPGLLVPIGLGVVPLVLGLLVR